ncbi:MAG: 6-phosphogluconolactonase [Propionibacteriaceae bacterium]|nr:6-phosphogluconolactonase [Propionibacteriaceae bacterium]
MRSRVIRLSTPTALADLIASRLLRRLCELQGDKDEVHLCLTGGSTADLVYERFAELAPASGLELPRLHLWWGDERFVAATDPDRNSLQAISRLARTLPVQTAKIHMMAAKEGRADPHDAASEYAAELGDVWFDITLLGMGPDGHVASIFPDHRSFEPTSRSVIGVTDSPKPPSERISLTLPTLSRSDEVWFMATGAKKAEILTRAIGGDATIPAAHPRGAAATYWFLDDAAASALPPRFDCQL